MHVWWSSVWVIGICGDWFCGHMEMILQNCGYSDESKSQLMSESFPRLPTAVDAFEYAMRESSSRVFIPRGGAISTTNIISACLKPVDLKSLPL